MDSAILRSLVAGSLIPGDMAVIFVNHVQAKVSRPAQDTKSLTNSEFKMALRKILKDREMTDLEASSIAQVTLPALIRWKNGHFLPDQSTRQEILNALKEG